MNSNLDEVLSSFDSRRIFASNLINFLLGVKLCYGGSAVKAYCLKHKDISKFLYAYLHDESIDLDVQFANLDKK